MTFSVRIWRGGKSVLAKLTLFLKYSCDCVPVCEDGVIENITSENPAGGGCRKIGVLAFLFIFWNWCLEWVSWVKALKASGFRRMHHLCENEGTKIRCKRWNRGCRHLGSIKLVDEQILDPWVVCNHGTHLHDFIPDCWEWNILLSDIPEWYCNICSLIIMQMNANFHNLTKCYFNVSFIDLISSC